MRRLVVVVLGLVVVIAMVTAIWRYSSAESIRAELRISEVEGEVHLHGPEREPSRAAAGTVLAPNDRLATGERARAVLLLGRETRIRLGPVSSVLVESVDDDGVSLELENGALQARVRPESGAVRVGNGGREVLATHGTFEIGVSEDVLQVRASEGSLALSGLDVTQLEEGQQATIVDRHADIGEVPAELLLSVAWPAPERTREEITRVSGSTAPGARVVLRGSFGEVVRRADADGSFEAEVPLVEGENSVEVEAVDPLGHRAEVRGMLQTRDTRGPSFRGGVEYER